MSELRERVADAIAKALDDEGSVMKAADAAIALIRAEVLEEAAREAMRPCTVSPHPRECEECRGSRLAYRWPDEIAAAIRAALVAWPGMVYSTKPAPLATRMPAPAVILLPLTEPSDE